MSCDTTACRWMQSLPSALHSVVMLACDHIHFARSGQSLSSPLEAQVFVQKQIPETLHMMEIALLILGSYSSVFIQQPVDNRRNNPTALEAPLYRLGSTESVHTSSRLQGWLKDHGFESVTSD